MIYNKFDIILEVLMLLTALVECRSPHNNYIECLHNICDTTLSVPLSFAFFTGSPLKTKTKIL